MSTPDAFSCGACSWFQATLTHKATGLAETGYCRRHAPAHNGFPAVFADGWCGDFTPGSEGAGEDAPVAPDMAEGDAGDASTTETKSNVETLQLQLAPAKPSAIHSLVCRHLRSRSIGHKFSFVAIADYIESIEGIDLDRTLVKSERRERWRNQVSQSIDKLRRYGCLQKGDKNSHYILVQYP
jgi:hypothetical protein